MDSARSAESTAGNCFIVDDILLEAQ